MWAELARVADPRLEDISVLVSTANGPLVLPMLSLHQGAGRPIRIMSTFAGCYGGPIQAGLVAKCLDGGLVEAIPSGFRVSSEICGNLLAPWNLQGFTPVDDFTHVLDLTGGLDAVRGGFFPARRRAISRAGREGIVVQKAITPEDWDDYWRLYQLTHERWVSPSSWYSREFFHALEEFSARYPEHIELFLACQEDRRVAGALVFTWNKHADYWHGAADERYFKLNGPSYLLDQVIAASCARGCAIFDFNPSGGHEGSARFKEMFGAQRVPLKRWYRRGAFERSVTRLRTFIH